MSDHTNHHERRAALVDAGRELQVSLPDESIPARDLALSGKQVKEYNVERLASILRELPPHGVIDRVLNEHDAHARRAETLKLDLRTKRRVLADTTAGITRALSRGEDVSEATLTALTVESVALANDGPVASAYVKAIASARSTGNRTITGSAPLLLSALRTLAEDEVRRSVSTWEALPKVTRKALAAGVPLADLDEDAAYAAMRSLGATYKRFEAIHGAYALMRDAKLAGEAPTGVPLPGGVAVGTMPPAYYRYAAPSRTPLTVRDLPKALWLPLANDHGAKPGLYSADAAYRQWATDVRSERNGGAR